MRANIIRLVAGLAAVAALAIAGAATTRWGGREPWMARTGSGNAIRETNQLGEEVLVGQAWSTAAEVAAPMLFICVVAAVGLLTWVAVREDS